MESQGWSCTGALCHLIPFMDKWTLSTPVTCDFSPSWGNWAVSERLCLQVDGTDIPPHNSQRWPQEEVVLLMLWRYFGRIQQNIISAENTVS